MLQELMTIMKKCSTKDMMDQLLMKVNWTGKGASKNESYIKFVYTMVLENRFIKFIKFLFLRADSHAQYEIRVYAETMLDTVKMGLNLCCLLDYRVGAVHVSAKGKKVIQLMAKGKKLHMKNLVYQKGMERINDLFCI